MSEETQTEGRVGLCFPTYFSSIFRQRTWWFRCPPLEWVQRLEDQLVSYPVCQPKSLECLCPTLQMSFEMLTCQWIWCRNSEINNFYFYFTKYICALFESCLPTPNILRFYGLTKFSLLAINLGIMLIRVSKVLLLVLRGWKGTSENSV